MNIIFKTLTILLFVVFTHLGANQKQTNNIAQISSLSLYNINKVSLRSIIKKYAENNHELKALKIVESLSKETYITFYKDTQGIIYDKEFPNDLSHLNQYTSNAIYEKEIVGTITAYYDNELPTKLDKEEIQWLKSNPLIKIAVVKSWMPFDITDKRGNHHGFHQDIVDLINKKLSLNVKLVAFNSWKEAYNAATTGKVHSIFGLSWTKQREDKYFNYSDAYHFSPYNLIVKQENKTINSLKTLKNKRVGIEADTIFVNIIKQKVPKANIVLTKNIKSSYESLEKNDVDAFLSASLDTILMKKYNFKVTSEIYDKSSELYIGTHKTFPIVSTILQKGINNISLKELSNLRKKWFVTYINNPVLNFSSNSNNIKHNFTKEEQKWIDNNPIVKLAVMNYWVKDNLGNSIHTDIIQLLNKYSDLHFIPIRYDTWKDGFRDANNGSVVHGIMNLSWTKEREKENFYYSKAYHFTPSYLIVKNKNKTIHSIEDLANKTVYLREKSVTHKTINEKAPSAKIINIQYEKEMYQRLSQTNEADAILDYSVDKALLKKYDLKVIQNVYDKYSGVSIGISHKQKPLISIINNIYKKIPKNELLKLQSKNYSQNTTIKKTINLSKKEKEWIAAHPKIRIHNEKAWAPFNFYEKSRPRGLSIDYIKILAKQVGIEIEFVTGPSWGEFIEKVKNKEIDVMLNIVQSKTRDKFLNFTEPYSELLQSLYIKKGQTPITNTKELFGKTFAVPKGFYYEEKLKQYPQIKILHAKDTLACLQAISFGKADAMLDLTAVVNYYKDKHSIHNVTIGGTLGWEGGALPLKIGVRKDWPELIGILNKSLLALEEEEINKIEDQWLFTNKRDQNNNINLTREEKKWIKDNKVKVGVENWAPLTFSTNNKDIDGIAGDVFKLIVQRTGLKVEYINDLWDTLLKDFKDKKIDILPAAYFTKQRAKYGAFSSGYFTMLDYIYVKEDNNNINSMKDLNGKKIAIQKGFGTIPKVREKFPDIQIIETKDLSESIDKVLNGEVEALFDGQISVEYKLQEYLITGLKGIPQNSFKAASLHILSDIDNDILKSILSKGLSNISKKEINKIKSDWIFSDNSTLKDFDIKDKKQELNLIDILPLKEIFIGLIIFIVLFYFIWKYQIKTTEKDFALKGTLFLIIGVFLFIISLITILTMNNIEKAQKYEIKESLKTALNSSYKTIKIWLDAKYRRIDIVLNNKDIPNLMENIHNKDNLKKIYTHFNIFETVFEDSTYYLLSNDFKIISSNIKVEKAHQAIEDIKVLINKDKNNNRWLSLPHKTSKYTQTHILLIRPIQNSNNHIVGYLAMEVNPNKEFTKILQNGQIGESGETYAFNEFLQLISKSRFDDQLIRKGILKKDQNSLLNVEVRTKDKQPTFLAKKALEKTSGIDANGYKDYRDIQVYGAWVWDDKLKIGFATEIDEHEAMGAFEKMKNTIFIIVFSIILFTIFLSALIAWISTKSKESLKKANNNLNKLLASFDENVIASRSDLKGNITYASQAFVEISGYSLDELMSSPHSKVRHPDMPKETFKDLWKTIQSGKVWRGEVKNLTKDGDIYWVEVVISPEFDKDGIIKEYSAIRQDITSKKEVEELSESLEQKVEERTIELKESQELFSSMASNVPGVIYRSKVDKNWTMFYISDEIEKLSGYPTSDFINNSVRSFANIMHKDDLEMMAKLIQEQIDKGEKFLVDYRIIDKDGVTKWVRNQGLATKSKDDILWLDGVLFDVTEQRELEIEITEQNKFIDSIMNTQENFVLTTNGVSLKTANKSFLSFFNVKNEVEFIEKYGDCVCDTFDKDSSDDYIKKLMGDETWLDYVYNRPHTVHKAIIKKDNKEHIFTITTDKILFKDEELKTAVLTDISELERVRKDIELILSNILLPILITSKKDKKILYANKYAQRQYEKPLEAIIGSDLDDVYTVINQKENVLLQLKEQGYIENSEEIFKIHTGKEFNALLSVTPLMYRDEDAYIGMVVDITKQKEIEKQIRNIHKHTKDSIEYASSIQQAIVPNNEVFNNYFDDFFTIWEPKDIVGGDIYLFEDLNREDEECLLMVIDCTGHGVPGAFVTMLVKALERQIVAKINNDRYAEIDVSPAWILSYFNKNMKKLLKQETKQSISNAGFDGQVIYYNKSKNIFKSASARNEIFYVQDNEMFTIKPDKHSIGYKDSDIDYAFKDTIMHIEKDMTFYISSDGYWDQNGGEKEFCYGKRRLKSLLLENLEKSMREQKDILLDSLKQYQGDHERNDDVTFVGFKLSAQEEKKEDEIIISISGIISQQTIDVLLEDLTLKFESIEGGARICSKISYIAIEQLQNILNYSKNKELNSKYNNISQGKFTIGYNQTIQKYYVSSSNEIREEDMNKVSTKFEYLNSLNPVELKTYYKELLRDETHKHDKGAGIGIVDMARKSSEKIEYKFEKDNNNANIFNILVYI